MPILDVELMKGESELIWSVYWKPIADLNIIPFDACTSLSYKLSTFRFLTNCTFRASSDNKSGGRGGRREN